MVWFPWKCCFSVFPSSFKNFSVTILIRFMFLHSSYYCLISCVDLPVWFWSASPRMWVHYGLNFVLLFKHCVWCWNITWYVVCTQQALVDWWGNEFFSTHYHQSSIFNQRKCQKARWRDTESSQAQEVTSQTPALTDGKFCALRPSSLS